MNIWNLLGRRFEIEKELRHNEQNLDANGAFLKYLCCGSTMFDRYLILLDS